MNKDLFAEDDDANTPLEAEEREALIPSYITSRHELNEAEREGRMLRLFRHTDPALTLCAVSEQSQERDGAESGHPCYSWGLGSYPDRAKCAVTGSSSL